MEAAISDRQGRGGRLGLIELLPHIQLMTLCCQCRWEWPCFPGNCLGIPVKMHQLFTDFHFFFNSRKHNVACIFRGMGSITTLSQQTLITQAEYFDFALILFLLLKFTTHSILFKGQPFTATRLHYRSCCASCVILTQWNYDFLNLL